MLEQLDRESATHQPHNKDAERNRRRAGQAKGSLIQIERLSRKIFAH